MHVGVRILFALGLVVVACGSRHLVPADAATSDGSDAAASPTDATDALAESRPPGCTPGEDQTCDDDPTVSALWGACQAAGFCVCRDGFSVNPATGRCRVGTACVASGADSWAVSVRLGPSDCAMRTAASCASTSGTPDQQATAAVASLVQSDCNFPELVTLRVELVSGCPTLFELNHGPAPPALLSCLEKVLSSVRWSCAGDTACVLFEWDTLP